MTGIIDEFKNLINFIKRIFFWFVNLVGAEKSDIKWVILVFIAFLFFTLSLTRVELRIYYDYHYEERETFKDIIDSGILAILLE